MCIRQPGVLLLPLGCDASPSKGYPHQYVVRMHITQLGEQKTMWSKVSYVQQHSNGATNLASNRRPYDLPMESPTQ